LRAFWGSIFTGYVFAKRVPNAGPQARKGTFSAKLFAIRLNAKKVVRTRRNFLAPSGMRCAAQRASANPAQRRTKMASSRGSTSSKTKKPDAIALLKAEHREVEQMFQEFEKTDSLPKKQELANRICTALKTHTTIEEEIFYPAFLAATGEKDLHHEAEVEHDGAKKLIAEIEDAGPDHDYFEARVTVLSEMIKHHVKEEEQRDGMFAKAKQSDMDLKALGEDLQQRKAELLGGADATDGKPPTNSRETSDVARNR
jgi:hemerythrin superfamily protein